MELSRNVVGWFEIPVQDMARAMKFYERMLDVQLDRHQLGPLDMAWFPALEDAGGAAGSLVKQPEHYQPSTEGVLVYFTAHSGNLQNELNRVKNAGGKVLQEKTQISEEIGYMALFLDSEGNRIALHSRK